MDAASFNEYLVKNGGGAIAQIAAKVAPGAVESDIRGGGQMRKYFVRD